MHKSIPIAIISLFLIASPSMFGTSNSNIFSKAMAIEEDGYYETNEYKRNVMDMTNDYEDKYKSSSYANDNNYKSKYSDYLKKIKSYYINPNINGKELNVATLTNNDLNGSNG